MPTKKLILTLLACLMLTGATAAQNPSADELSRWLTKRVAPEAPLTPAPASAAVGVPLTAALTWEGVGATSWDVRFGTTSTPATVAGSRLTMRSFSPPGLKANTRYCWQVLSRNAFGTALSPVWCFTTAAAVVVVPPVVVPPVVVPPVPGAASPNGTRVPPATSFTDATKGVWTIGPNKELRRNGVQQGSGFGTILYWCNGTVTTLGTDGQYWSFLGGPNWQFASLTAPTCALPVPPVVVIPPVVVVPPVVVPPVVTPPGTLPAGWVSKDVGTPGRPGSCSFTGTVMTVKGTGLNWYDVSSLQYCHKLVTGNQRLSMRILSSTTDGPNQGQRPGVEVRVSVDANSAYLSCNSINDNGQAVVQERLTTGAPSTSIEVPGNINAKILRMQIVEVAGKKSAQCFGAPAPAGPWSALAPPSSLALGATYPLGVSAWSSDQTSQFTMTADNVAFTVPALAGGNWFAEFLPSVDHAKIVSYKLDVFMGDQLMLSKDVGKPTVTAGKMRVAVPELSALLSEVKYDIYMSARIEADNYGARSMVAYWSPGLPAGVAGPGAAPIPPGGTPVASQFSAANYTAITNNGPTPVGFRPYAPNSPWNLPLPKNAPQNVDNGMTALVQNYARNSSSFFLRTAANNYLQCGGAACGGVGGFPIWVAKASDPEVTWVCGGQVYGCNQNDQASGNWSFKGRIPANARPGCTVREHCGDSNLSVVQLDGTMIDVYGCEPQRNFQNGDVLAYPGTGGSTGVCSYVSGMIKSNLFNDKGTNGTTTSGPNYIAEVVRYNELVTAGYIPHALIFTPSCTSTAYVYPGTSRTKACNGSDQWSQDGNGAGGVPTGQKFFLDLSIARIDELINSGALIRALRPIYVALREYGGYAIDTADLTTPTFTTGSGGMSLEDARPWVTNGQPNPWVAWFQANGGNQSNSQGGNPFWQVNFNMWQGIAGYLKALSPCYATGTCNDSPAAGSGGGPAPSGQYDVGGISITQS